MIAVTGSRTFKPNTIAIEDTVRALLRSFFPQYCATNVPFAEANPAIIIIATKCHFDAIPTAAAASIPKSLTINTSARAKIATKALCNATGKPSLMMRGNMLSGLLFIDELGLMLVVISSPIYGRTIVI